MAFLNFVLKDGNKVSINQIDFDDDFMFSDDITKEDMERLGVNSAQGNRTRRNKFIKSLSSSFNDVRVEEKDENGVERTYTEALEVYRGYDQQGNLVFVPAANVSYVTVTESSPLY